MRLLIITDLHSFSDDEFKMLCKTENYDACFCLGDIDVVDLRVIRNAVQGKIYALNGNHDGWDTSSSVAGIKDMHGKLFNLGDLTFIGMQGAFKYTDCRWRCMYSQPEASEVIKNFPKADILFSHSPPKKGLLFERVGSKSGLSAINEYIKKHKPVLHIYGHSHQNSIEKIGKTTTICIFKCAIVDTETMKVENIF